MGFLTDMLFRVFVFEVSFGIFLFLRASIMGFVWCLFSFLYILKLAKNSSLIVPYSVRDCVGDSGDIRTIPPLIASLE